MEKIFFSGNGFIKSEEVQNYAMYRIAEVAQTKGKQYFLIYQSLSAAAREIPATQPIVGAMGNKPTAYAFVLFLDKEQKGAFNTEKVLKDLAWIKQPVDQIRVKNQ